MIKLQVGDKAPEGTAVSQSNERVDLATLWPDGPILLTFLRHFG
jgi:hypothetical protein